MTKNTMLLAAAAVFLYSRSAIAQEDFEPSGSPYAKIYFNYHVDADGENTGFQIQRAYFGYEYRMTENFSADVLLDVGAPEVQINDSVDANTSLQFTAFLKEASLTYKKGDFSASAGMISLKQFKIQENHWAHRYIEKSFQDLYGLGTSADLGVTASYKFGEALAADITVRNGEGYKRLQSDNDLNTGLGITFTPLKGWTIRGFYDYISKETNQYTVAHFVGYRNNKISAGAEFNTQINHKNRAERNLNGYSAYAGYNISERFELFGRYDRLYSNSEEESQSPWNIANDGKLIITGVEYSPIEAVDVALNYQGWLPEHEGAGPQHMAYVNFQYAF